jgi:hypothetical protein
MEPNKDPNQLYGVPLSIYQERYRALDPQEASRRTGVPFDPSHCAETQGAFAGRFTLILLGYRIHAAWPDFELTPAEPEACPRELYGTKAQILLIRHLLEGTAAAASGAFLPYRELPWGSVYEQQFTGRCMMRLAFGFGSKPDAFTKACQAIGGVPYTKGDASCDLPFLPGLTVRLILWSGDDEFPPQSQWLFSDNTPLAFTAEDVACMGDVIIGALKETAKR